MTLHRFLCSGPSGLVVCVAVLGFSRAALPCSVQFDTLAEFRPSAGEEVPDNVVWLAPAMTPDVSNVWSVREGAAGELRPLTVTFDADFTRLEPPPLTRGLGWELVLTAAGTEDDEAGAVGIPFSVGDVDEEAPPAPAVTHSTEAVHNLPFVQTSCGPLPSGTSVNVEVEVNERDGVRGLRFEQIGVDGEVIAKQSALVDRGDTKVTLFDFAVEEGGPTDYQVTAIDAAGNESEATIVTVDLGCGGGCSSAGSAPFFGFGLLLLLRRRRR